MVPEETLGVKKAFSDGPNANLIRTIFRRLP